MNMLQRNLINNGTQSFPPIRSQIYRPPSSSSDTSSPILVLSVLGIIITAFLLLSYYIFVIKCWLNCHRNDIIRRFSISRSRRDEDPLMGYDPATENRGVDESVIRAIPIFQFKRVGEREGEERSFYECAVCLNEFQEEERLRVLPTCSHAFHIDCIDIWLQNNANCPLCRSSISSTVRVPFDQIIAPSCSPQDQSPFRENLVSSDLDFVVIEVRGDNGSEHTARRRPETSQSINPSPRKLEKRFVSKKTRKLHHVSSMGDECIDIRHKDDQFSIQPIRRSFSMDSSTDRQLFLAVQDIIQQSRHRNEVSTNEGCSSSVHRRIVSFGQSQNSRKAVLPIQYEA